MRIASGSTASTAPEAFRSAMNFADSAWSSLRSAVITREPSAVSRSSFTETPASFAALPQALARPFAWAVAAVSL